MARNRKCKLIVAAVAFALACVPQMAFAVEAEEAPDAQIVVDFEGPDTQLQDPESAIDDGRLVPMPGEAAVDASETAGQAIDDGGSARATREAPTPEGDAPTASAEVEVEASAEEVAEVAPIVSEETLPAPEALQPAITATSTGAIEASLSTQQSPVSAAQPELVTQSPGVLADGAYVIKVKATYGTALSTGGALGASAIKAAGVDGAYDQVFYFQVNTSGFYAIFSLASGLALDTSAADARQASYSGSNHQLFEIRKVGSGYALVSKAGRALVVSGSAVKTGGYDAKSMSQRFAFVEAPLVIPGVQVLYASGSVKSSMGVAASSRSQGAACQTAAYAGAEGQKLTVARNGLGYEIKPLSSGMGFAPSGSSVTQQSKSYVWQPAFAKSGARRGLAWTDPATGKAMQVSGSSVKLATFTGALAQSFVPALVNLVTAGCYNVKNLSSGTVLEVEGGNWVNGGNVSLYTSNGTGAQFFDIKDMGSGLFRIVNAMTGYALSASGSNVYQYSYSGAYDQLWVPVASRSGGIAWVNASTGRALNAAGTSAGANASTVSPTYAKAQSWTLVKGSYESDPVLQTAMRYVTTSYSQTGYQIMVDRWNCRTIVAEKSGGVWRPIYNWVCSPGAPSTPTVGGSYTVGIRGYSFDGALGGTPYTCYYYTQFWGDYLFHSIPYYQGTWTEQDSRLGQRLSHGCVRLATSNAKWIYDNIPYGTYVYVYN